MGPLTTTAQAKPRARLQARQAAPKAGARAGWSHLRRATTELGPETIELIAQRVARLLREDRAPTTPPVGLVDAAYLARHLGLTRTWVYQHAEELGAIRVGKGSRARMRFDLAKATAALGGREQQRGSLPAKRRRRARSTDETAEVALLPLRPPGVRGVLARIVRQQRMRG